MILTLREIMTVIVLFHAVYHSLVGYLLPSESVRLFAIRFTIVAHTG